MAKFVSRSEDNYELCYVMGSLPFWWNNPYESRVNYASQYSIYVGQGLVNGGNIVSEVLKSVFF